MSKAAKIIRDCLEKKNLPQRQLSIRMGEDARALNNQINYANDMKFDRVVDVLEHIGYSLKIKDNSGIMKVHPAYAKRIIETGEPKGLFFTFTEGMYFGINTLTDKVSCAEFKTREECFRCLLGKTRTRKTRKRKEAAENE